MKNAMSKIVTAAPKLMDHIHLNLTLCEGPAAAAVGLVCASGVIIYGIYSWEKLEERKLSVMELQKKSETCGANIPDTEVDPEISESTCIVSLEQNAAS